MESVLLEPLAAGCPVRPGMTESGAGIGSRSFCIIFTIFVGVSKYNLYVCKERMILR